MKPEPMTPEQIDELKWAQTPSAHHVERDLKLSRSIEAARDAQWEEMLAKQEPVATLWREKNQKLYPGPSWMLTNVGKELPIGIEHSLYAAPVMAEKQDVPETNFGNMEPVAEVTAHLRNAIYRVRTLKYHLEDGTLLYAAPVDQAAEIEKLKNDERAKFEAHWHFIRGKKSATRELARHPEQPQTYVQDSANRHWVTWQAALKSQQAEIERLEKELSAVNEHLWGTEDDVISLHHQLDDQQAEIERLNSEYNAALENWNHMQEANVKLKAEIERLRSALEKLARLGNGDKYGNSDGNMIARAALGEQK